MRRFAGIQEQTSSIVFARTELLERNLEGKTK
jgi:hypothetical protein